MLTGDIQVMVIKDREELRKKMFLAHDKQKTLIKKRDLLLESDSKDDALKITHEIAQLEDFIKKTENDLRMTD